MKEYSLKFSYPEKGSVTVFVDNKEWLAIESNSASDQILQTLIAEIRDLQERRIKALAIVNEMRAMGLL